VRFIVLGIDASARSELTRGLANLQGYNEFGSDSVEFQPMFDMANAPTRLVVTKTILYWFSRNVSLMVA